MICIQMQVMVDNGGCDMADFVRRNIKELFSVELAKGYNLTGVSKKGKRAFKTLMLFQLLFGN